MNYSLLDKLINEKKIGFVASKIEITDSGLRKMLKEKSLKVETLEKICEVIGVDICEFFGEKNEVAKINQMQIGNGNKQEMNIGECRKELQHLREQLAEKERLIAEKERLIQILLNK